MTYKHSHYFKMLKRRLRFASIVFLATCLLGITNYSLADLSSYPEPDIEIYIDSNDDGNYENIDSVSFLKEGEYQLKVELTNYGEKSLDDDWACGVHIEIYGGEIVSADPGTFTTNSGISNPYYLDENGDKVTSPTDALGFEFIENVQYENGWSDTGYFSIYLTDDSTIKYRAWIMDQDNIAYNPDSGNNEPYITRDPDDVHYNRHLFDSGFTALDYNTHSKNILLGKPDLKVIEISSTPSEPLFALEPATFHIKIQNQGVVDAENDFSVRLYTCSGAYSSHVFYQKKWITGLDSGNDLTIDFTIPRGYIGALPGEGFDVYDGPHYQYISVEVDYDKDIIESNEYNNIKADIFYVISNIDLLVSDIYIDEENPLISGEPGTIYVSVENIGTVDANKNLDILILYWSYVGPEFEQIVEISGLNAGEYKTLDINIPSEYVESPYLKFIAVIDYNNKIHESDDPPEGEWFPPENEYNNFYYKKFNIIEPSPITFESCIWENEQDEMITPYDMVNLTFIFKNTLDQTLHNVVLFFDRNTDLISFEDESIDIGDVSPNAEFSPSDPVSIKIAGLDNDEIMNKIIDLNEIISLKDSIKVTAEYDSNSQEFTLTPTDEIGDPLYIQYPDFNSKVGEPLGDIGDFYEKGDADFNHPNNALVRKYVIVASLYPGDIFPDYPSNILDNIYNYIDNLLADNNPAEIDSDIQITEKIEEGTLVIEELSEEHICISQAYLMTSFARTLGLPSRELTVALGFSVIQTGPFTWSIVYDQEGAAQIWYDDEWHLYDTWLEKQEIEDYLDCCVKYRAWHDFDQRSSREHDIGLFGHSFAIWSSGWPFVELGSPEIEEEWMHLQDGVKEGLIIVIGSPVITYITDENGYETGDTGEVIIEDIPESYYLPAGSKAYADDSDPTSFIEIDETIFVPCNGEEHSYEITVTGIDNGSYSITLGWINEDGVCNVIVFNNYINVNETHNLHVEITSEGEITITKIPATIDIDPDTLNLKSKGKWITCYIELPEGYGVANINISTILLNDIVHAEDHPTDIGDYDNDGIPDLMVKFDRSEVQKILETGEQVEITINGEVLEIIFEGNDFIKVI